MSYNEVISPRPEVLRKEGIEGVIDIENLRDTKHKSVESRPEDFFEITYPTSDIRLVIQDLNNRFNSNERSSGLFLLEGLKGSGKSHLELLIYHLLNQPELGKKWLEKHKLDFNIPTDTIIIIHKFTDFPLDSIWTLVFSALGIKNIPQNRIPDLDEFRNALNNRKLVLIFDELEMGIKSMVDERIQHRNISFLQMLSEESLRNDNASVTIFASVYDSGIEPGSTLKRVNPVNIKFSDNDDRLKIILHRLFTNYDKIQVDKAEAIIKSYINSWKKYGFKINEKFIDRVNESFPFTPDLIDMVLYNVQSRGGFQGTRGALGLLSTLIKNTHKKADLISSSYLNLKDKAICNRISDLDQSQKILQCAENDLNDLQSLKYISEIIGTVTMATLAPSGRIQGISENELALEVLKPGDDVNEYNATLQALLKYGTFFQYQEGNYFFDVTEKPNAKVEYRSLQVDPSKARDYSLNLWKNVFFKDPRAVVYKDLSQVRSELNLLDKNNLRFILSPKRLSAEERISIYNGNENQNQIVLLEPRDDKFNGIENHDILKWAQRAIAAEELEISASEDRKRQYEKIKNQDRDYIRDTFKRAGLFYVWFQHSTQTNSFSTELESLGNGTTRDDVIKHLREEIFPRQSFEEHLLSRKENIIDKSIREVESEYKKTLGFPVQTALSTLLSAFKNLCSESKIGLRHERDSACGRYPNLSENELLDSKIVEPFEDHKNTEGIFQTPLQSNPKLNSTSEIYNSEYISNNDAKPIILDSIQTSFKNSIGELRLEVAAKLNDYPDSIIKRIQFFIFSQQNNVELTSLPSALRGTLSGNSDIVIDLVINKNGDFSKAQIEQMIEMLPNFNQAQYRAELKIKINEKVIAE